MCQLIFLRKYELSYVNLSSTQVFSSFGEGGSFAFQLHTLGAVKL